MSDIESMSYDRVSGLAIEYEKFQSTTNEKRSLIKQLHEAIRGKTTFRH